MLYYEIKQVLIFYKFGKWFHLTGMMHGYQITYFGIALKYLREKFIELAYTTIDIYVIKFESRCLIK